MLLSTGDICSDVCEAAARPRYKQTVVGYFSTRHGGISILFVRLKMA